MNNVLVFLKMAPEMILPLIVLMPVIGGIGVLLTGQKHHNLRETVTLVFSTLTFLLVLTLYLFILENDAPSFLIGEMLPGLVFELTVEPLGMLFALIASFLWIITSLYAIGYMRGHHKKNQTRFYFFFAVAISSTLGLAFSSNLLTLFLFYEALTLLTFPLVTHSGSPEAKRAGRVYLGILMGTSIGLQLLAIIWTWSITGTLDFSPGGILAGKVSETLAGILLLLYVFGVGKAALMPFHRWLPAAMVAPTPVSALLHAVAVVKAGVFTILKIALYIFGQDLLSQLSMTEWIQYLAAATILIASLIAMRKDNLKARLAYSTVSQLSYIILGAMLANSLGFLGGGMHIATHAFGKITLFFCAGAILVASHKTDISQMKGLGRTMPVTMIAFFIASVSIIGLPPLAGLWSKWYLALGALENDQIIFVGVLMLSSLLNIAYLLPIPIRAFFSSSPGNDQQADRGKITIKEAPLCSLIAILITTTGCLVLFFYPAPLFNLLNLIW